jgi:CRP-like cAMP-binding protein
LLRQGEPAVTWGFVLRGILRQYESVDGREHNMAFSTENHLFGSLTDMLSGQPSSASIDALEDVEAITISWPEFQSLCARNEEWNTAARAAAGILVASKTKREKALLALDAEERYRVLVARRPEVALRVPLYHLASYLGMRPEHLSRVRRKLATTPPPR